MSGSGTLADPWDLVTAFAAPQITAGKTLYLRSGTYPGDFSLSFAGGNVDNIITVRPYQSEVSRINGSLYVVPNHTTVQDLLVNNDDYTDRSAMAGEEGVKVEGTSITIQDLVISNTWTGIYLPNTVSDIVIDGCIIFFNGWLDATTGVHGHGIYLHGGSTTIKNCIIFDNASNGIQVYGLVNHDNCTFQNNICFSTHEMWRVVGDYGMNYILSVGANAILQNNCSYSADGQRRDNEISQNGDGILTNNYLIEGIYQYNSGSWATTSGNVFAPEASNAVKTFAVRGRLHVAIYNWQLLDTVTVDVSSVFAPSASVNVTNVQDYFVDIAPMTVSAGGTLDIDMRAVSHTVATPQGVSAPVKTFPEFGCFVITVA